MFLILIVPDVHFLIDFTDINTVESCASNDLLEITDRMFENNNEFFSLDDFIVF